MFKYKYFEFCCGSKMLCFLAVNLRFNYYRNLSLLLENNSSKCGKKYQWAISHSSKILFFSTCQIKTLYGVPYPNNPPKLAMYSHLPAIHSSVVITAATVQVLRCTVSRHTSILPMSLSRTMLLIWTGVTSSILCL